MLCLSGKIEVQRTAQPTISILGRMESGNAGIKEFKMKCLVRSMLLIFGKKLTGKFVMFFSKFAEEEPRSWIWMHVRSDSIGRETEQLLFY